MSESERNFALNNYLAFRNESACSFDELRNSVSEVLASKTGVDPNNLKKLHRHIDKKDINPLRIEAFNSLNSVKNWEEKYFSLGASVIQRLIGPDVSIQIKLNLSIQMPHDETSVLMLHSDTLSGQSPYEVVLWTALTDAHDSNALYMFDREQSLRLYEELPKYQHKGMAELFTDNSELARPMNAKTGDCILFSSTLFHGNRLNQTDNTRISINCRFKALFSPEYSRIPHERVTGTFYKPLHTSPLTDIGLNYNDEIKF